MCPSVHNTSLIDQFVLCPPSLGIPTVQESSRSGPSSGPLQTWGVPFSWNRWDFGGSTGRCRFHGESGISWSYTGKAHCYVCAAFGEILSVIFSVLSLGQMIILRVSYGMDCLSGMNSRGCMNQSTKRDSVKLSVLRCAKCTCHTYQRV